MNISNLSVGRHSIVILALVLVVTMAITTYAIAQSSNLANSSTYQRNQQRLESLSELELMELQLKKSRFDSMPDYRQEQLRQLHQEVMNHPNRDELMKLMGRYAEWLKSLTEEQRAQLGKLETSERIDRVRQIRLEQAEEYFGVVGDTQLPQSDVPILFEWLESFMERDEFSAAMQQMARDSRLSLGRRSGRTVSPWLAYVILARTNADRSAEIVTADDVEDLKLKLSQQAGEIVDSQASEREKRKLVAKWIEMALQARFNPQVSNRELMEFYGNEMTADQRERVDEMTPDRRLREIKRYYIINRLNR